MAHRAKTQGGKRRHRLGCWSCDWKGYRQALDGGEVNDSDCPACGGEIRLLGEVVRR